MQKNIFSKRSFCISALLPLLLSPVTHPFTLQRLPEHMLPTVIGFPGHIIHRSFLASYTDPNMSFKLFDVMNDNKFYLR